jgi:hypothetical protein
MKLTCDNCKTNAEDFPYRIGNKKIGYSAIIIVGCRDHAKLAIDRLNSIPDHEFSGE